MIREGLIFADAASDLLLTVAVIDPPGAVMVVQRDSPDPFAARLAPSRTSHDLHSLVHDLCTNCAPGRHFAGAEKTLSCF